MVLVEGPPEGDDAIRFAGSDGLEPPVALLVYVRDEPGRAVHYPFARFSPEWRPLRLARQRGVPVRFIALPAAVHLACEEDERGRRGHDPLSGHAAAAGYEDAERWW